MMPMSAVDEDDKLDADAGQAGHPPRSAKMLAPVPARGRIVACVLLVVSTLGTLAGPVPGEARHRPGHLARTTRPSSTPRSSAYIVVALIVLRLPTGSRCCSSAASARASSATCACGCSTTCMRLSMPFYDREKAGVIVSRMTSRRRLAAGARAAGAAPVRGQHAAHRPVDHRARPRVVAAAADLPDPGAVRGAGVDQVPARLEQGVPDRPRSHRPHAVGAAGGHHRRAGDPGLRPRGRRDRALRQPQPAPLQGPHALGLGAGLVPAGHRVLGARPAPRSRSASAGGW